MDFRFSSASILILIVTILLISNSSLPAAFSEEPSVEIGYGPRGLFDADIGSPVFMAGEEVWVRLPLDADAILLDPYGIIMWKGHLKGGIPTPIYKFTQRDPTGIQLLRIEYPSTIKEITLHLSASRLNASIPETKYSIEGKDLKIEGRIILQNDLKHEGGILLLSRINEEESVATLTSESAFNGSRIFVKIRSNASNPYLIEARPYAPNLTTSIDAVVWAEVSFEISLLKKVGNLSITTYVSAVALRTSRRPLDLQSAPNETLSIILPQPNQMDKNGDIPFRSSRGLLSFYIQIKDVIYIIKEAYIFAPEAVGTDVIERFELNPLTDSISFSFKDNLSNMSRYLLTLILTVDGVDRIWKAEIVPTVARIRVVNILTEKLIPDHRFIFDQGVSDSINVDGTTYVILTISDTVQPPVRTGYDLIVEEVALLRNESNPISVELSPLRDATVNVSLSRVSFYVYDAIGNEMAKGMVKLFREGSVIPLTEVSWQNTRGPHDVTLPLGFFTYTVEADGLSRSSDLQVEEPTMRVDIRFGGSSATKAERPSQLPMFILIVSIIAVEVAVAAKVWSKALKTKIAPR